MRQPTEPHHAAPHDYVDIVFTGPPGPEAPEFVEVEDMHGRSIRFGEWTRRDDGFWALRISADVTPTKREYFAALAMQGRFAATGDEAFDVHEIAYDAVRCADALIAALNGRSG